MSRSLDRRRDLLDACATLVATLGGVSVIALLAVMFVFLVREALPLADSVRIEAQAPSLDLRDSERVDDASAISRLGIVAEVTGTGVRIIQPDGTAIARVAASPDAVIAWSAPGGSLIIADGGGLERRVLFRDEGGQWTLSTPRPFESPGEVLALAGHPTRPGFAALTASELVYYRLTMDRPATRTGLDHAPTGARWLDDRKTLELETAVDRQAFVIDDPYPSSNVAALWLPVSHDFQAEPVQHWQPTATFPKFSLMPLTVGTLKAAVLGMLFGAPLAVFAAIHVGFMMPPRGRRWIKPTLELMEGMPTVLLGLLGALVLAPLFERHLLGFLLTLVSLPLLALLGGPLSRLLGRDGHPYQPTVHFLVLGLLLCLALLACFGICAMVGDGPQAPLPGGLASYFERTLGWDYATRNSLVVGIVVGIAIFPSIFTLAEDAIFAVPSHQIRGAFALGATRAQALMGIVLPMASPGIAAALIIGFSRAVGETMIVLMVSGNTPLTDLSIWRGLRSLAATLAIELPETTPGSEHYRVLFLAAAILFVATFSLNAVADWVRFRLRKRYGSG